MKKEELGISAFKCCMHKSDKNCNLFFLPVFLFQNFRVVGFRYLRCCHLYAQQCPANVGVFICKKSANDELQLLQPALSLETSLSEEDHERLAHAMQAEERDSVLSAA